MPRTPEGNPINNQLSVHDKHPLRGEEASQKISIPRDEEIIAVLIKSRGKLQEQETARNKSGWHGAVMTWDRLR